MRFNKEDLNKWIKEYGALKESGMSLLDIEKWFKNKYDLKGISSIRKNYDLLHRVGRVEVSVDDSALNNIATAKADLLVNRKINIQMNKSLHQAANDEAKWQLIKEKLQELHPISAKRQAPKIRPRRESDRDVIYVVGDIHYRGPQDKELVVNTFAKIGEEIVRKDYNHVTLILTGDNVDGEIHNEQTRTNAPVIDATMEITNLLIDCIKLIPEIENIYMVYGNHEEIRLWGDKGTTNNVGKFIYWGLKHCLPNINVQAGEELLVKYKDKNVLILHGHQGYAKTKARIIEHCSVQYGTQPDYIILGHFHTSKSNQFNKNHWLITAPALKNFESDWDKANGYCGLGQYLKLKINWTTPQITTMNIKDQI